MKQITILFVCLFFSHVAISQSSVGQLYKEALAAYEQKDYRTYLSKFQEIEKILPNRPAVLYNLASAYALNGNKKAAFATIKKLIWLKPDPEMAEDEDFTSLASKGKFQKMMAKMEKMLEPVNESRTAFQLSDPEFHPEGIAYDPATESFYCSSIRKRKIIHIDRNGNISDFITSGQDSILAVTGIRVDPIHHVLWACTGAVANMEGYTAAHKGYTAIYKYDIEEKKLLQKYELQTDGKDAFLGDLTLHPKTHEVYVTDSYSSNIYKLNEESKKFEKYFSDPSWRSLQGLDFSDDGNILFVADYRTNIYRIDTRTLSATPLKAPKNIYLIGVDGLYFYENSIVAIHNGIQPFRVVEYILTDDLTAVKKYDILEHANPKLNEPTLGVFHEDEFFYIANSPWAAYTKDGKFIKEKLKKGIIMKVRLWETGQSLQQE